MPSLPASASRSAQPGSRQFRSKDEAKPWTRTTGSVRTPGAYRPGTVTATCWRCRLSDMARRIEIELTSSRPDGTWTWRAAGALKPRGVVEGSLIYDGAKAGDVVRADAEFEIEGITIVGVLPPKERKRAEPERLEIIGPPRPSTPGVTSSLT